jgi:hypothetical protein
MLCTPRIKSRPANNNNKQRSWPLNVEREKKFAFFFFFVNEQNHYKAAARARVHFCTIYLFAHMATQCQWA